MMSLSKSQILCFTEKAIHLARRAVSRYSSKFSKHRYTLPQHVVLLCLKIRKSTTYRGLLDELIEMPRIRHALGLAEIPTPSTLCKAFNRLEMAVWCFIEIRGEYLRLEPQDESDRTLHEPLFGDIPEFLNSAVSSGVNSYRKVRSSRNGAIPNGLWRRPRRR